MPPIKYSSVHLIPLLCSAVVNRDGQEHPPASTPNLFPLATDTEIPWDGCGSSKQNVLGAGGVSLAGGVPPDLAAFCRTLGMLRGKGPSQGMLLSWSCSPCHPQSIPGHPHFVAPRWWPQEGTGVTLGVWVTDHPWGNLSEPENRADTAQPHIPAVPNLIHSDISCSSPYPTIVSRKGIILPI